MVALLVWVWVWVWVWVCVSVIDGLLLAACSINDCICCCKHSFLLNGKRAKARFLEKKNTLIDERLFALSRFLHPHPWLVGNVLHWLLPCSSTPTLSVSKALPSRHHAPHGLFVSTFYDELPSLKTKSTSLYWSSTREPGPPFQCDCHSFLRDLHL
jgi:hypothetical protein